MAPRATKMYEIVRRFRSRFVDDKRVNVDFIPQGGIKKFLYLISSGALVLGGRPGRLGSLEGGLGSWRT